MSGLNEEKQQILVLHDGELADMVRMQVPSKRIREFHKGARITLLTSQTFEALLKHSPYYNTVEPTLDMTAKQNFFERLKSARSAPFDVIYDLSGNAATKKIKNAARFSKTRWVDLSPSGQEDSHPLETIAAKMTHAGLGGLERYNLGEAPAPDIDWIDFVAKRSRTLDPAYFGLHERYALFAPAGDDSPPPTRWPKERWASLASELKDQGVEPVIIGGPSTREIGRYVAHVTPGARDLTGRANLVQLAGLGRQAQCAFGEDVPLLHLLVAAGSPAVLFHPGDNPPLYSAPRGLRPTIMMHAPTLAQINPKEALQAMRCAGGFDRDARAA